MKYIFTLLVIVIVVAWFDFLPDKATVINSEGKTTSLLKQVSDIAVSPDIVSEETKNKTKASCSNGEFLMGVYNNHMSAQSKKTAITFQYLSASVLAKQDVELILQGLGLDILSYRKAINPRVFNSSDLRPVTGKYQIIGKNLALKERFETHFFNKNYQAIISQVEQGILTLQHIYDGLSLLSAIFLNDKEISSDIIVQLISVGLAPTFADLVVATQLNLPKNIVMTLRDHYFDEPMQTWYHNYHHNNLVMAATENLNSDLFYYWFEQDIPYRAKELDYTALDVLPTPKNDKELSAAIDIFVSLAKKSLYPYKNNTLDNIKQWLPLEVQQQFNHYFNNEQPKLLSTKAQQEFDFLSSRFNESSTYNIAEIKEQLEACYHIKFPQSELIDYKPLALDSFYIEAHNNLQVTVDNMSKEDQVTLKRVTKLHDYIQHQQWDILIEQVESIANDTDTEWLYGMTLLNLIIANAPEKPVNAMLEHRVILSPETIFLLIKNNNVELANKLLNYDLEVNTKKNNMSPLEYAKKHNASQEMLDFLQQF